MELSAEQLLEGPRGRRVCWELLRQTGGWEWEAPRESAGAARLAVALAEAVAHSDVGALACARDAASFLGALADSVSCAWYWQEPDGWDRRLADRAVAEALAPVAAAVSSAPAADWWTASIDAAQYEVIFDERGDRITPDPAADGHHALRQWRAAMVKNEQRAAAEAAVLESPISGVWWSIPTSHASAALQTSTRTLGSTGPVGLHLVEDELGWTSASSWPLRTPPDAAILEIRTPADWGELVARYPLPVPLSRRHDWWRATGQDLAWVIPDYSAVAAEYDAIHVTVAGYLTTAGRAIPAGDAHTVLAGWDPDQTWWLTRAPVRVKEPTPWLTTGDSEPFRWAPRSE